LLPLPVFTPPDEIFLGLLQRYPQKKMQTTEQTRVPRKQVKQWQLCGIVQEGGQRYALVEQGGEVLRFHVGDAVNSAETIIEVQETGITLKGLDGVRQVLLYDLGKR